MYTICSKRPDLEADVGGLTVQEAFTRIMALEGLDYSFTRTGRVMHLLLSKAVPDAPEFLSAIAVDALARNAIMAQVCCHGFGQYRVIPDEQYRLELASRGLAA